MSDIKIVAGETKTFERRIHSKSKKKYPFTTREFYFKNKKGKACDINRDDLKQKLNAMLSSFDEGYEYQITCFFENYGWRTCPVWFNRDSSNVVLWSAEYNEDWDEEYDAVMIGAIKIDKVPSKLFGK